MGVAPTMPHFEVRAFAVVREEGAVAFRCFAFVQVVKELCSVVGVDERRRVSEHARQRKCRSIGHDGLGVRRADDVAFFQAQAFGERVDKARAERERAAFEDHRCGDVGALGKTANGLLGDSVEQRPGDVLFRDALVQEGLDVRFRVDAAAAGDVVEGACLLGKAVEAFHRHAQKGGDFVHEGARASSAGAVHAHVGDGGRARRFVGAEEDDLRVLTAELDGGAGGGVQLLQCKRVRHHFLDVGQAERIGDGARAGSAERGAYPRMGKAFEQIVELSLHAVRLA